MKKHDCGVITAFRDRKFKTKDGKKIPEFGRKCTKKEDEKNRKMKAELLSKGYSVKVSGRYIENFKTPQAKEVGEYSFFVYDINDGNNLRKDLFDLASSEKYGPQDSILFIPNTLIDKKIAYLIGANS